MCTSSTLRLGSPAGHPARARASRDTTAPNRSTNVSIRRCSTAGSGAHRIAVQAHLVLGLAERQAGCAVGDEEAGDALGAEVGDAGEGRVVVGVGRVRDPRLGAVEGPAAVVGAGRFGRHRSDVRSGVGFGEAIAAEPVAAEHVGQEGVALLVGAIFGNRVAGEGVHADADGDRHPHGGDLLNDLEIDLIGLAATTEFLGVGQGQQAEGPQGAEGVLGETALTFEGVHPRSQLFAAYLPGHLDERAGLVRRHQPRCCHGRWWH